MRYFFLLLSVVGVSNAQISDCNLNANRLKIFDYISENLVALRNASNHDVIMVKMAFSDSGVIENVALFPDSRMADEASEPIENLQNLNEFIKTLFRFCPTTDFDNSFGMYSSLSFRLPLTKTGLTEFKDGIAEMNAEIPQAKQVAMGSQFTVKVNIFQVNTYNAKKAFIKGKLNLLHSGVIEFAPNYFLSFRVLKTSESKGNRALDFLDYKIFNVTGTTARLVLSDNHDVISDGKTNIKLSRVASSNNEVESNFAIDMDVIFTEQER